jgi:hypothetical protein
MMSGHLSLVQHGQPEGGAFGRGGFEVENVAGLVLKRESSARSASITFRAKAWPSMVPMSLPMKFRQASFMPMMPMVEKWFFQYRSLPCLISRR